MCVADVNWINFSLCRLWPWILDKFWNFCLHFLNYLFQIVWGYYFTLCFEVLFCLGASYISFKHANWLGYFG